MHRRRISVVIPAYRDAEALRPCLEHLSLSESQPLECIVVCDGGFSEPGAVAEAYGAKVVRVSGQLGPAHARNLGASVAGGDVLVFVDSDVCVRPDTLGSLMSRLEGDPGVDAVFGAYDDAPADPGFISQYKNLMHHFVHRNSPLEAATFWSGCGAIRAAAFRETGGFDESYRHPSIEDIELGARLRLAGKRLILDPSIEVKHLKRWTLGQMLYTDIVRRAIPWAKLILHTATLPNHLNLQVSQRLSVALVVVAAACLPAILWWPWVALVPLAAGALALLPNLPFYRFLRAKRGWAFAAAAAPLHLLYFLYSGLTFLAVAAAVCLSGGLARGRAAEPRPRKPSAGVPVETVKSAP